MAVQIASDRVIAMATPGPLDLAALLQKAACLFTPEGGAAHLAASVRRLPWSFGRRVPLTNGIRAERITFHSRGKRERTVPVERVWQALQSFLSQKKMMAGRRELGCNLTWRGHLWLVLEWVKPEADPPEN